MTNKSVRAPNTLAQRVIIGNLRFFTWLVVHCKTVVARITKLPFRKRQCCVRSKSKDFTAPLVIPSLVKVITSKMPTKIKIRKDYSI